MKINRAIFSNRAQAGRTLAERLKSEPWPPQTLVLGLPRGGVVVAYEVAVALGLPLDILVVRKLGVPGQDELAMGAIASGGGLMIDRGLVEQLRIPPETVDAVVTAERRELERREAAYGRRAGSLDPRAQVILLIDDGLATGATMRAAVSVLRRQTKARLVAAVPVASPDSLEALEAEVDGLICLHAPEAFASVGQWYADFAQTTDQDVQALLAAADRRHARSEAASPS